MHLIKPEHYEPLLGLKQTEQGIKQIKDFFQVNLSTELRLRRVTAPLFVPPSLKRYRNPAHEINPSLRKVVYKRFFYAVFVP